MGTTDASNNGNLLKLLFQWQNGTHIVRSCEHSILYAILICQRVLCIFITWFPMCKLIIARPFHSLKYLLCSLLVVRYLFSAFATRVTLLNDQYHQSHCCWWLSISNGSWCPGIKGRISCTVCFALLWNSTHWTCIQTSLFIILLWPHHIIACVDVILDPHALIIKYTNWKIKM